jgi:hypothetical protein
VLRGARPVSGRGLCRPLPFGYPEAGELDAGLIHCAPGSAGGTLPDECPQWGVEHCPGVVPEHHFGYDVVPHEVSDAVVGVIGVRYDRMDVVLEVDEEGARSGGLWKQQLPKARCQLTGRTDPASWRLRTGPVMGSGPAVLLSFRSRFGWKRFPPSGSEPRLQAPRWCWRGRLSPSRPRRPRSTTPRCDSPTWDHRPPR